MTMTTVTRQVRTAAAAAVAALALTTLYACGDETPSAGSGTPSAPRTASNGDVFNDADVRFATDMVPHHAEAIEMVTLTDGRPLDPEVQALAEQVRATQAPEVETMVDWLTAWDAEVPETSLDHANADHGDDGHGGGEGELAELAAASDEEFQQRWLELMVEHHTAAIEMAEAEQDAGTFDDAVALAGAIIAVQQREIEQMQALLDS